MQMPVTCGWRAGGGNSFAFFETLVKSRLSKRRVRVDFLAMATRERKGISGMFGGLISLISLIS
jgi:hypothetical protein